MTLLTMDFETYYSTSYSVKRMPTLDYVTDPLFKVHMLGFKVDNEPTQVIHPDDIHATLLPYLAPGNDTRLLCHNTAFDALILQIKYNLTPAFYLDTQLMFRGTATYLKATLKNVAETLFPTDTTKRKGNELENSKGKRTLSPEDYKTLANYCVNDVSLTYDCFQRMRTFYPKEEIRIIHETLKMWVEPKFKLDTPRVEGHLKSVEENTANSLTRVKEHFGITQKQLASNPQFATWLTNHDINPPTKINDKGAITWAFAKDDLDYMALQKQHPELHDLWDARRLVKSTIEISRAKRLLHNAEIDNGLLRVPLKYYGAHTGRYSGGEKINLQNLKRGSELRLALRAKNADEYVYVSDLSQIEARVNAWLSDEEYLLKLFAENRDVYSEFASMIYDRPIDRKKPKTNDTGEYLNEKGEIVAHKHDAFFPDYTEGFVGKVAILGLGYGMSGDKFQETLAKGAIGTPVVISSQRAQHIVYQVYRKQNRNIVKNWGTAERHLRGMLSPKYDEMWGPMRVTHQRIMLPNGMFITYPSLSYDVDHNERMSFSYWNGRFTTNIYGGKLVENVVQALARIIVMEQALRILDTYPELKLALQVHDELIFTGPKNDADSRMDTILKLMSTPPKWCATLPTCAEGGYDINYSK